MEEQTIHKFEQAINALKGAVEDYSMMKIPLMKEDFYTRAFDTGKVYISPVSYNDDRNAGIYEVELTKEEKAAIRDMVMKRITSDAEKRKKYLEELADKIFSVIFDEPS